jgi:hypothetical protein
VASSGTLWIPLLVTCAIAGASAIVGLVLYRHSTATIRRKGLRLTGAAAVAVVCYLGMTRFYLQLDTQLDSHQNGNRETLRKLIQQYDVCREQENPFQCEAPATQLRDLCSGFLQAH